MRNICRRIEALEKAEAAKCDIRQAIARRTLGWFCPEDSEVLISAYGAYRGGRPLTERESAVRQAYTKTLRREYQSARVHSTTSFERTLDIGKAIIQVMAFRMTSEQLQLVCDGILAAQEGGVLTDQERAAIEAYASERTRLCQLAGFASMAEFEAFYREAGFSEGGDRS